MQEIRTICQQCHIECGLIAQVDKGKVVLGKKSGKLSVKYFLEQLGIKIDDEQKVAAIVRR